MPTPQLPLYVVTMKQLGATIPWTTLKGTNNDGRSTRRANPFPEESRHVRT